MLKKITISLLLIFAINISMASARENMIENFLQNRLYLGKKIPSFSHTKTEKITENSLLPKIAITKKEFFIQNFLLFWNISFENFSIQPYLFVTIPNGQVMKFSFVLNDAEKNISFQIPLFVEGEYQIEILDTNWFPLLNEQISFWKIEKKNENSFQNYDEILSDINRQRENFDYQKMEYSPLLQKIAIRKVQDMQKNSYMGHISPDGKDVFAFVLPNEKKFYRLGENVSGGNNVTLDSAYKWILDSPAHRYNVLFPAWKKVGMHFAEKDGVSYFVQVFSE